jgi:predicted enzyme related to lactoylglutathione lyase
MDTARQIKLLVFSVKDLVQAKALFGAYLGAEPYVDGSYYAGYRIGDQEVGLVPNGPSQETHGAPIAYVDVPDIKASLAALVEAGGRVRQEIKNVGGGRLVASVTDAAGNELGLRQG